MSDTALFFKRQAAWAKYYSPVILHGFLYVGAAVAGIVVITLKEWKSHEANITVLDVQIFWATCVWVGFTNWLAFVSKKVSELEKREKPNVASPPA